MRQGRVSVAKTGDFWGVVCTRCDGSTWTFLPAKVASARGWRSAWWWANWHNAEHDRTRCACCDRDHDVPACVSLKNGTVGVGDRVFAVNKKANGWIELTSTEGA